MNRSFGWVAGVRQSTWNIFTLALAVGVPVGIAAALVPVRDSTANATIALVLAVSVALLAATGTRASAAIAAISASIGFDVFHTRPYGSFAITRSEDIQTTVLLLLVGLVVGQLATRNRRNRFVAASTSYDLWRVHGIAEMVAAGEPGDQVVIAVANELVDLLDLKSAEFSTEFADPPGPYIERHGDIAWGSVRWGFRTMGLPTKEVSLIVQHQGLPLGRYVLVARPGNHVVVDQLIAAVALGDQAGAALAAQRAD